ncbi:GAF domain-containing protein, partial [Candidatus Gottesmanbacteria bacterium]|nr:GAF domain-containing protein [Candidatus Gottesmanbacteria bacterium]
MADSSPSKSPVGLNPAESRYLIPLRTPILQITSNGDIRWTNHQALSDYGGKSATDLVGKNIQDLSANPQTSENLTALFKLTMKANVQFKLGIPIEKIQLPEVEIKNAKGRRRVIQYRPTLIELETGGIKEKVFQIEATDITQQKQAEALTKAAELLSKNLSLEDILSNMRGILRTLVPHDTANVMLLDEQGKPTSNISWGYDKNSNPVIRIPSVANVEDLPILKEIFSQDKPVIVPDTAQDTRWIPTKNGEKSVSSYLGVPIHAGDRIIGILNLNHFHSDVFGNEDAPLLQRFADQLGQVLDNAGKLEDTQRLAMIDPLTGLPNRRAFNTGDYSFTILPPENQTLPLTIQYIKADFMGNLITSS